MVAQLIRVALDQEVNRDVVQLVKVDEHLPLNRYMKHVTNFYLAVEKQCHHQSVLVYIIL